MATHVSRSVSWAAGAGTPEKYTFNLDVNFDVVSVSSSNIATIRMWGTVGVQNNPANSRNSFKASDFATVGIGAMNLATQHQFTPGVEYYQSPLPCIPDNDAATIAKVLIQFRGDTWRYDPVNSNNCSSLYIKNQGTVLNSYDGSGYRQYNIDITFTINVSGGGDIPILTWTTSGAASATQTEWMNEETWLSWFQMDYRPGQRKVNGTWVSHNRSVGHCDRIGYGTMRTSGGGAATGDPPSRKASGTWYNQRKIGAE